jgi:hypothetical protein
MIKYFIEVLNICKWYLLFHLSRCSVSSFAWANSGWGEFDFHEQPAGLEAREKGRILTEAWAISVSRVLFAWPPTPRLDSLEAKVKTYFSTPAS